MNVTYDGIVEYGLFAGNSAEKQAAVVCVFKTRRHGYIQVGRNSNKVIEYSSQPSLYNFTDDEREYIESILAIVYRLVYDAPKPETLK